MREAPATVHTLPSESMRGPGRRARFARRARIGYIGSAVHHEGLRGPLGGYAAAQEEGGADERRSQAPRASPVDHWGRRPAVRPRSGSDR